MNSHCSLKEPVLLRSDSKVRRNSSIFPLFFLPYKILYQLTIMACHHEHLKWGIPGLFMWELSNPRVDTFPYCRTSDHVIKVSELRILWQTVTASRRRPLIQIIAGLSVSWRFDWWRTYFWYVYLGYFFTRIVYHWCKFYEFFFFGHKNCSSVKKKENSKNRKKI